MSQPETNIRCPHCGNEHPVSAETCSETGDAISLVYRMNGRTLNDKYKVFSVIGEGGMGIVYEGKQKALNKRIAIKFLYPSIKASEEVLARFRSEAQVAASIAHKNIRDILDMDTTPEGIPFIVMEYLEGKTLGDILKTRGKLSPETAARITLQILSALNGVHSRGVVHRDLKPDNVFICQQAGGEEIVKIVDFGVSHLASSPDGKPLDVTGDKTPIGTPRYLSPEAAASEKVDARADIYAVGTILYEMVTGRHPFEETNYNKVIVAILTREPPPPREFSPHISEELEKLILKALEKEPYKRFSNAAEFAQAIRSIIPCDYSEDIPRIAEPVKPRTAEALEAASAPEKKPARRWLTPVLITAPLVLLLAGGLVMVLKYHQIEKDVSKFLTAQKPQKGGGKQLDDPAAPARRKVTLEGVPKDAVVRVDGVLHPENPVILEAGRTDRAFKIEAPGCLPWEKSVAVEADIGLTVQMVPIAETKKTDKPDPVTGENKGKTQGNKKGKPYDKAGKTEKKTIDLEYPDPEK